MLRPLHQITYMLILKHISLGIVTRQMIARKFIGYMVNIVALLYCYKNPKMNC